MKTFVCGQRIMAFGRELSSLALFYISRWPRTTLELADALSFPMPTLRAATRFT